MLKMLLPVSVLMSMLLLVLVDCSYPRRRWHGRGAVDVDSLPECRGGPIVRQRYMLECPRRAVCGDEWLTVRDWYNGTACRDHRIVFNCRCPGDSQCPVGNEQHLLFANRKHRQYLCEPKCTLRMCSTFHAAAKEMVQNSAEFNHHNFYRINCRCPGHNTPMDTRRGMMIRSTSYKRVYHDFVRNTVSVQYRCSRRLRLTGQDATCPSVAGQRPVR